MKHVGGRDFAQEFIEVRRTHQYGSNADELALLEKLDPARALGMYEQMFTDDMEHMLPLASRNNRYSAKVSPDTPEVRGLVMDAVPRNYLDHHSMKDAVTSFVEAALPDLLFGPVYYEVVVLIDPAQDNARVGYRFEKVASGSVTRRSKRIVQEVPIGVAEFRRYGHGFRDLTGARLVQIQLSRAAYRQLALARPLWRTADADTDTMMAFMNMKDRPPSYSLEKRQALATEIILSSTRNIGWSGRGLFTEGALEPYRIARDLTFTQFRRETRDALLTGLIELVRLGGESLREEHDLAFEGLAAARDIDSALASMRDGTLTISELTQIWD